MIADIFSNKTLSAIVAELFIRGRKLNILSCCYYKILLYQKNIMLNPMHYFIMKIPSKRELQQITLIICQILTFKTLKTFIKIHSKTLFFFGDWLYSCVSQVILYVLEIIY